VEKYETEARSLFQRLGHLPIGIAVGASLVRRDVRYTIAGLAKNLPADAYALLREAVAALSPMAQELMAAMAVCAPEGFRLTLAAEVADLGDDPSLDALQEIHSRSLVEELDRSTRRYRLHALVREAAGASDWQRRKHAECVLREFEDWVSELRECEKDMADWQTAFSWLLGKTGEDQTWSTANDLAYRGYRLTQRLGRLPEAHEICERMVQEANRREDTRILQVWHGNQAVILRAWWRLDEAMALLKKQEAKKVEAICLELGNREGLAYCYCIWGLLAREQGDSQTEREKLERALALFTELKMPGEIKAVQDLLNETNSNN
jgi:hypothetical protein